MRDTGTRGRGSLSSTSRHQQWLASFALFVSCIAVFWPVTGFDFVGIDDPIHFVRNEHFRGLGTEQLRWMFLAHHGSAGYDPLAWLTFGADYELWGLDPQRFHLTSLLLYALCMVAFHRVTIRVMELGQGGRQVSRNGLVAATCMTALFALHPLRVESVAWLSERHGVLATIFALLSVQQYLRIRSTEPAHLAAPGAWALSLLYFALALISKSTVLFLPLCLLVLDVLPLRRLHWPTTRSEVHDRIVEKAPFFALSLIVGLLTIEARAYDRMWGDSSQFGLVDRLSQSALGFVYYLAKTFVPTDLSPIQLRAEWQAHAAMAYAWAIVGFVLIGGVAWIVRRRWPEWPVALVLYGLILVPVVGLFQSGPLVVADRYSLLALAPLFVAGAIGLDRTLAWGFARRAVTVAILLSFTTILILEVSATRMQLMHWRDADALWAQVFAASDDLALMAQNRGALRMQLGEHEAAEEDFALALEARPNDPGLLNMAGQNAAALGRDALALELLDRLIELRPKSDGAYRARARVRAANRDVEGAVSDLEAYLRLRPTDDEARRELAEMRRMGRAPGRPGPLE